MSTPSSKIETNEKVESFKDLLENEEVRYVRKGYGLIFASVMTYSYFFILPDIIHHYYRYFPVDNIVIMYSLISMMLHTVMLLGSNIVMYAIYRAAHPFFEKYRILNEPWPWEKNRAEFMKQLKKTIAAILFNNLVILPLVFFLPAFLGFVMYDTGIFSFPSCAEIAIQIIFFMIVEDTAFYWSHRLFHTPWLYKRFHKKHHEYKTTIGIAAEYSDGLEYLLTNIIPSGLGPTLLASHCHIVTWYLWLIVRILETTDGHCGYEFSWSPFRLLPFSGSANYHNFHHSHNVGNYSSFFTYWDSLCQTNKHYWKYLSKQEKSVNID